jgi:four helix bundle protein
MFVNKFEDLVIFQIALQLAKEIHELTEKIPQYWRIEEVDDIRRSSPSVSSNIAEGFGQRFYPKKFLYYLNIAKGSSEETQNHLLNLYNKKYINNEKMCYYLKRYKNLSVRILNFINYLKEKHNIKLN